MTSSEKDISKSRISGTNIHEESNTYEDEINLIDYFIVLWKRKYFIFLAAILPAMIVGIFFFLSPRNYKVTYVYDVKGDVDLPNDDGWKLNGKNYNLLVDIFYSEGNFNRLIDGLRKDGFKEYASQISDSNNTLDKFIQFEATPPFLDISRFNITNPDQLKQIRDMKALLLEVTIVGKPKENMYKISSVIRDNIENVIPLYIVQKQLLTSIIKYNDLLADIERNRFNLELSLKKTNKVLASLKEVSVGIPANKQDNIVLQFNVGEQSQYLPLDYQIQASESMKIELEENIKTNEEKYKYHKDLLGLNNKVLAELGSKLTSKYSEEQFKAFLNGLAASCEKPEMKDYLSSYIKKVDNGIMIYKPVTEKPRIYPISKGTVKKSGIVFVAAFMIAVFAAFLREGLEKNKTKLS
jgi:capsular polysaccharide biosynthesis protein